MDAHDLGKRVRALMPYGVWYWSRFCYHALHARVVPPVRRLGPVFQREHEAQARRQWWARAELLEYQSVRLRQLIRHAYDHVPFYRRRFDEHGVGPDDVKDVRDLPRLPTMTREDLRHNGDDLLATDRPRRRLIPAMTGGTSGTPAGLYMDQATVQLTLAHEWRQMNWMGWRSGDRVAILRGSRVLRPGRVCGRAIWERRPLDSALVLSTYDLRPWHMTTYLAQLRRFAPKWLLGYPSSLDALGRTMLEGGHPPLDGLRGSLTSSETLFADQRDRIERAFGAPLYDKFGNSEQTCIAGQCERLGGYHDFMDYGVLELLDREGRRVDREDGTGEIVGTGFANWAMPLIRYRTDDFAVHTDRTCECGRELRLLAAIRGRWQQEQVLSRDGSLISIAALNSHADVFAHVAEFQYVQVRPGVVRLLLAPRPSFVAAEARRIARELRERTGDQLDIEVAVTASIPRTGCGKHRFLVQRLALDGTDRAR